MFHTKNILLLSAFVAVLYSGCASPEEPLQSKNAPPPKNEKVEYNPHIEQSSGLYRDTIRIYGQHFGVKLNNVAVILNDIIIEPVKVLDTCILFQIPNNIPLKVYNISLVIIDDEIKNFAKIEVLGIPWGDFVSAELNAVLNTNVTVKVFRYGQVFDSTYQTNAKLMIAVNGPIQSKYADNKLVYNYYDNQTTREEGHRSESGSSRTNMFYGKIDTLAKTVTDIVIATNSSSYNASPMGSNTNSDMHQIELGFGTYSEIENGIVITVKFSELERSIRKISYYRNYSPDNYFSNWSYSPIPPYSNDNFITIVLMRKKT